MARAGSEPSTSSDGPGTAARRRRAAGGGARAAAGALPRLRERLAKSRQALRAELSASLFDRIDAETWERLEEALILADVGAKATADVVGRLEREVEAGEVERRRGGPRAR